MNDIVDYVRYWLLWHIRLQSCYSVLQRNCKLLGFFMAARHEIIVFHNHVYCKII